MKIEKRDMVLFGWVGMGLIVCILMWTDTDLSIEQMQKDRNFEKLVQAMTIAQLHGKTSAAKRHVNVGKK